MGDVKVFGPVFGTIFGFGYDIYNAGKVANYRVKESNLVCKVVKFPVEFVKCYKNADMELYKIEYGERK